MEIMEKTTSQAAESLAKKLEATCGTIHDPYVSGMAVIGLEARFKNIIGGIFNADFVDCDLGGTVFKNCVFKNRLFNNCNLENTRFYNCTFDFTFKESELIKTYFEDCKFENFIVINSNLLGALITLSTIERVAFYGTNLQQVEVRKSDVRQIHAEHTDIWQVNFSTSTLPSQKDWLKENFEITDEGVIVYKTFNAFYDVPPTWKIEAGAYIEETCNSDRTQACGYGINFGTPQWIHGNVQEKTDTWRCLIEWEDLIDVVVPFETGGKARCGRLKLLENMGPIAMGGTLSRWAYDLIVLGNPTSDNIH